MPIKGLTDRGLAFPEIGRIRKGAPKGERKPGRDLDYFRVEFYEGEEEAARIFHEHYGDKPRALRVFLPFNEIERVWDAYLEAYTAGAMVARSDGEIILFLRDPNTGEVLVRDGRRVDTGEVMPYDPTRSVAYYTDTKGQKQPVEMKPYGRLKVVIPELHRLAYLTMVTTSTLDIANLSSQLQSLATVNRGRVAGIPLILKRSPRMVSVPMPNGKRQRMKKWLLSLEAAPEFVDAAIASLSASAMPVLEVPAAALPPGGASDAIPATDDTEAVNGDDGGQVIDGDFEDVHEATAPSAATTEAPDDPITAFWLEVKRRGIERSEAQAMVAACDGDFVCAYNALMES